MALKKRVKCLCGCRRTLTTQMEKSHLLYKHITNVSVPEIVRKRRAAISQSHGEPSTQGSSAEASTSLSAGLSTVNDSPDLVSIEEPLGADHTSLWNEVLLARRSCATGSSSTDESPSSHASFISQPDSDIDAQPVENSALPYNPATYGLKIDALLHERSTVARVINGQSTCLYIVIFCA
ncbi:hypothetical protein BDV93DRAFT_515976 [Ceratobasidium sp. AG-I]|nr:hypothetical protein BDV93DRAFT_515970 [Ceratobasidium sp. AG-I]KAF8594202.1 hypothetical protein BDV93DRAFT_515976 [Ceratobasidium sp. AG-I]